MEDNVEVPNPADSSHELDLEPVFSAIGIEAEMEAIGIRTMLEANGIDAIVVGSSSMPNLPFEVRVPRDQAESALRVMEEAKAAGPAAAEEAEQQSVTYTAGLAERATPILPSLNLDESVACYQQLGFSLVGRNGDDYAIVRRDSAEIHLFPLDDEHVAENSGCYVYVSDARTLHSEIVANGYRDITAVAVKPWGMLEFSLKDSSGNCLRFGQRVKQG
ncbi:MAG: hypothetical protein JNL98_29520 [Bryobacterales bacterium]|nr:hypothetical protein [Bryobacterales bacterium]